MNNTETKPRSIYDVLPPEAMQRSRRQRYARELRFQLYGASAIAISILLLGVLLTSILYTGISSFRQAYVKLDVYMDPGQIDLEDLNKSNFRGLVRDATAKLFPDVSGRSATRALHSLISGGADFVLRDKVSENPKMVGGTTTVWVPADDDVDVILKDWELTQLPEDERRLTDQQIAWVKQLKDSGRLELRFNMQFFTAGDSREPELAGIWGAVVGSFYTILITLVCSFPLGVASAIYLEEFAPKNKWTDIIEVNINNLAAVPSIVFGLLGLAVFLNFFGLPRSAPLVGGLVLTLMTLPTIIIASRAAIKAVPPSIREAALGVGSSKMQAVMWHVLPLALPGILTGTIIGMAQALGETAPLLMIGMVAFIVDIPDGFTDAATVLPVQIFLWADSPERTFLARTAAAIIVLLFFLISMNALAIFLRKKFEKQW